LYGGFPAVCGCERFLTFRKGGAYDYVEQDSANEYVLAQGAFRVSRVTEQLVRGRDRFWLYLENNLRGGDFRDHRLISLRGRDTLTLRDSDPAGGIVVDGGADTFVRERRAGMPPARARLPLSKRPWRTDVATEVDTNCTHSPVLINRIAPAYPESLRSSHVRGTVRLKVLVGVDGRVKDIHVLEGETRLRRLAVDAVKRWVFQPYSVGSKPEPACTLLSILFPPESSP
jgi:TonB family protein